MRNHRIAIWQGFAGDPWFVDLLDQTRNTGEFFQGRKVERIARCVTHAEAIEAASDWIKANPLAVDPKAAA